MPGVGVGVEVDEPNRAMAPGDGADVRLRDRVVAAEDDRHRARRDHLADRPLDRGVRARGVGREHRCVPVVEHPQLRHRVHLRLQVRPRWAAGGADCTGPEARSGPVGDEVVGGRADDRDVDPLELRGILRVRERPVRQQSGVVGLFPVLPPALERVDHGRLNRSATTAAPAD